MSLLQVLILNLTMVMVALGVTPNETVTGDVAVNAQPRKLRNEMECSNKLDSRSCSYFVSKYYCYFRRDSMMQYCEKACKFCVDPPCHLSKYGCCLDSSTVAQGPNMQGCQDCKDVLNTNMCKVLRRRDQCFNEKIRLKCAVTCGYCRLCKDEEPIGCKSFVEYDGCLIKRGLMANVCRKSCNLCGKKDPCYSYMCPKGSICRVDRSMKPYCECHGNCNLGDYYTKTVCGRDGNEYKNLCQLKKRNCGHKEVDHVTVMHYGKCRDNIAIPSDKRTRCQKNRKESSICSAWALKGLCASRRSAMVKLCPKACNLCAAQAAKPECHYSRYGCCLDNKTTCLSTDYKGCPKYPACKDLSKTFCKRFAPVCGHGNHKKIMKRHCPISCNHCV